MSEDRALRWIAIALAAAAFVLATVAFVVTVFRGHTTAPAPAAAASTTTPPGAADPDADALLATIHKLGDLHYALPRATLETLFAQRVKYGSRVRAMPEMRDGTMLGFRMSPIEPCPLFHALGFVDGDVAIAINGYPLLSATQALDAYLHVRAADGFAIDLRRGGDQVILRIDVR